MATVINTYARAFADAVTGSRLDAASTLAEAQQVAALAEQSKDLRDVWDNPSIPAEQKRAVLDAIVQRAGISRPDQSVPDITLSACLPAGGATALQFAGLSCR